jgi:histidinol-phosphate/aromatic aminotransferase/cobyric acid decarboxylase-like protein
MTAGGALPEGGVAHGGLRQEELDTLGLDRVDVLDLSASLNPSGPHPNVLVAAAQANLRYYPEPEAATLRDAIARHSNLDPSQVLVTPGATAAIHLAARALLSMGDACWIFPPTFGEYAAAAHAAGARIVERTLGELDGAGRAQGRDVPAQLAILCNPNNPTGEYLERDQVEALLLQIGAPLLLDVAYDPFVVDAWDANDLVGAGLEVLVVHSMTKLHAVPGLRLGYLTGSAPLIRRVAALQPSWSVGTTAIAAGLAALEVDGVQRRAAAEIRETRSWLCARLGRARVEVREGLANFLLVNVGGTDGGTPAFRRRLLRRGFAVRDCASFGMPDWVRVAVPPDAAARRLLPAFLDALAATGDGLGAEAPA